MGSTAVPRLGFKTGRSDVDGRLTFQLCAYVLCACMQVVEDGYEFFAKRQLVTVFSAPNYCGEFDNAGAMMSVDDSLMCSFQILKPAEKKQKYVYGATTPAGRPATPPPGGPRVR